MTDERETLLGILRDLTDNQKYLFSLVFGPAKEISDKNIPRALKHVRRRKRINTGEIRYD